jgi:hypothetical protein
MTTFIIGFISGLVSSLVFLSVVGWYVAKVEKRHYESRRSRNLQTSLE